MNCNCEKDFPWKEGDNLVMVRKMPQHNSIKLGSVGRLIAVGFSPYQPGYWLMQVEFEDGRVFNELSVNEMERID